MSTYATARGFRSLLLLALVFDAGGTQFDHALLPLLDITTANVDRMEEVWRFDSGPGGLQTSPLVVNGVLCALMPARQVVALDAATGNERWRTQI